MSSAQEKYWQRRLASPAFRRVATAAIAAELRELGKQRVGQVIDPRWVRDVIAHWDARVVDPAALAEVAIAANRRTARRLSGRGQSLADLVDRELVEELEAALDAGIELTVRGRDFITTLMEREFVRGLFTDIIFTAIASFQRKANPLFGALAVRALEDQIKGFIRLFMPMLQAQAIAFVVDRANQRAVLDFARAAARHVLTLPIGRAAAIAGEGGPAIDRLVRRAAANPRLAALGRQAALAVWDDVFATVKTRRIGDLVQLEAHAEWLAERAVAVLLPLLRRPAVVSLIAAEVEATAKSRPARRRR